MRLRRQRARLPGNEAGGMAGRRWPRRLIREASAEQNVWLGHVQVYTAKRNRALPGLQSEARHTEGAS